MPETAGYIPTLQNPTAGTDPKALERAILNALEKRGEPDTQAVPMRHWTQALAGVANTGVDQFQARAAATQLAQQRANAAGAYPSLEGGDSDNTSGGNNNNTASSKFDDTTLDPHARTTMRLESDGNPNAITGSNRGLFQFGPKEEARYGLDDKNWSDPNASYEAFQKERKDHETLLRAKGIDPTPDTLYLAHQQGAGGAISHLSNPKQPAWMSMYQTAEGQQKGERWARQAIINNPVSRDMDPNISSGDFVKGWQKKYNDIYSGYTKPVAPVGGPSSPQAVLAPGGQGMEPQSPPGSPTPLGRALAFAPQVAQNSAPAGTNPPVRSQLQDRLDQAPKDIWDPKMYSGPNPALNRDVQQRAQQMRGAMGVAAPESVPIPQPRPQSAPQGALPYTADDKPPGAVNVAQATPQGQPQANNFIAPSQRVPQGLDAQVKRLLSDPDPTVRASGAALHQSWYNRINEMSEVDVGGVIYRGNVYKGFRSTGAPAPQQWGVIQTGEDMFGNKLFSHHNAKTGQTIPITGSSPWQPGMGGGAALGPQGVPGQGAPGQGGGQGQTGLPFDPSKVDMNLKGEEYLKQFPKEVQEAVRDYQQGLSMPVGNPRGGWATAITTIAKKYGNDIGEPADDTTFTARRTMRNSLSQGTTGSLGGQINAGNTALEHLSEVAKRAASLGNWNTPFAKVGEGINWIRSQGTEQDAKIKGLLDAADRYGGEITKFYAGSPGSAEERLRFRQALNGATTAKGMADIIAAEVDLIQGKVNNLTGQISGTLGKHGAEQYPVIRDNGKAALTETKKYLDVLGGVRRDDTGAVKTAPQAPAKGEKLPDPLGIR